MGTGGKVLPGRDADHSPLSSVEVKYEVWLLNNETVFIKNIVLTFMYVAIYLLQSSSLGLLYGAACVPSMRGNISGNHFV
jgi:hypothetical protein